jgi:hypothetical protein
MLSSNTAIDPNDDHYQDDHYYHTPHSPSHLLFTTREPLCYFTYIPSAPSDHWSTETPLPSPGLHANADIVADPSNPLLAARIPLLSPASAQSMSAEKLLQLQTAAAHSQRSRPQPRQDVLDLSDDSSSSMSSRSSSVGSASSSGGRPKICSRCQTTFGEFVAISLNSHYCKRCAKITGFGG